MEPVDPNLDAVQSVHEEVKVPETLSTLEAPPHPTSPSTDPENPSNTGNALIEPKSPENSTPTENKDLAPLPSDKKGKEPDKEPTSSSNTSKNVFVSLKSPVKSTGRCSPNTFEIAESLNERNLQKEAKITSLRLRKKADEIGQLQTVPKIDEHSRKLMQGKNFKQQLNSPPPPELKPLDEEDSYFKLIPKSPTSANDSEQSRQNLSGNEAKGFDNSELIKSAVKLREAIPAKPKEQPKPKLDMFKRHEMAKEKTEKMKKEIEERKIRKEKELCTFKPKLLNKNQISESGSCIIKRSRSGSSLLKEKMANESITTPRLKKCEYEEKFELSTVKVLDCAYSQITPFHYHVRYKDGYNEAVMLSKSRPMMDYKSVGNVLE